RLVEHEEEPGRRLSRLDPETSLDEGVRELAERVAEPERQVEQEVADRVSERPVFHMVVDAHEREVEGRDVGSPGPVAPRRSLESAQDRGSERHEDEAAPGLVRAEDRPPSERLPE